MPDLQALNEAALKGGAKTSRTITEEALKAGVAPVTQPFADEIGADGYGANAPMAVARARKCLGATAT